jgi:hypothetical protein
MPHKRSVQWLTRQLSISLCWTLWCSTTKQVAWQCTSTRSSASCLCFKRNDSAGSDDTASMIKGGGLTSYLASCLCFYTKVKPSPDFQASKNLPLLKWLPILHQCGEWLGSSFQGVLFTCVVFCSTRHFCRGNELADLTGTNLITCPPTINVAAVNGVCYS